VTTDATSRVTVNFDHHGEQMGSQGHEVFADLRRRCPVAYTNAHGGFWVISGHDEVQQAARDDATFSSANDFETRLGVVIPPLGIKSGIIEEDPPSFYQMRRAYAPWFSPGASEVRRPLVAQITDYCIDQIIEAGQADLTKDIFSPVPALLTLQFIGFPVSESGYLVDLFHRFPSLPPDAPTEERESVVAELVDLTQKITDRAVEARKHPKDDFLSVLAKLEVDGRLLTPEEVAEHAMLVLAGGIDTTTVLLSHTFLHLNDKPDLREKLVNDPKVLATACDEYLRYFAPIQGLARTVTRDCVFGGQQLHEGDRVLLSWASANLAPEAFDDPERFDVTRTPNRHLSFGVGIHRCLGAPFARLTWQIVTKAVLSRLPDYEIDVNKCIRYSAAGHVNGVIGTPASFTPGERTGAQLPI
jgi:cytochrome P450